MNSPQPSVVRTDLPSPLRAYAVAIVATAASAAVRFVLDDALGGQATGVIFAPAIMAAAYAGGLRAGLLATTLSCLAIDFFFMSPRNSFAIASMAERWPLGSLAASGVLMSILGESLHRARRTQAIRASDDRELARQLERERARLVAAQSVAKVGSWENDVATGTLTWSAETHRIFGTDPAHFAPTYASFRDRVHPDDRARLDEALARSLREPRPFEVEHRIVIAPGVEKVVAERWETSFDDADNPVIAIGTCRDITEHKAQERLRDAYREQLQQAARKVISLQDEQRRRMAVELRDSVGQGLSALGIQLATLETLSSSHDSESRELVRRSQAVFEEACRGLRVVIGELRPDALDEFGLAAALQALAEGAKRNYGFELVVEAPEDDLRLPPRVEAALFQIAQEAVSNVARHAGARRVLARLRVRAGRVLLLIADHGCGFARAELPRTGDAARWGLLMMQERAESVGARLRVSSTPGHGTAVFVSWTP